MNNIIDNSKIKKCLLNKYLQKCIRSLSIFCLENSQTRKLVQIKKSITFKQNKIIFKNLIKYSTDSQSLYINEILTNPFSKAHQQYQEILKLTNPQEYIQTYYNIVQSTSKLKRLLPFSQIKPKCQEKKCKKLQLLKIESKNTKPKHPSIKIIQQRTCPLTTERNISYGSSEHDIYEDQFYTQTSSNFKLNLKNLDILNTYGLEFDSQNLDSILESTFDSINDLQSKRINKIQNKLSSRIGCKSTSSNQNSLSPFFKYKTKSPKSNLKLNIKTLQQYQVSCVSKRSYPSTTTERQKEFNSKTQRYDKIIETQNKLKNAALGKILKSIDSIERCKTQQDSKRKIGKKNESMKLLNFLSPDLQKAKKSENRSLEKVIEEQMRLQKSEFIWSNALPSNQLQNELKKIFKLKKSAPQNSVGSSNVNTQTSKTKK